MVVSINTLRTSWQGRPWLAGIQPSCAADFLIGFAAFSLVGRHASVGDIDLPVYRI
jgi:hypothetical protein